MNKIEIELTDREINLISSSFNEYGGGSAAAMERLSGHTAEELVAVRERFQELRQVGTNLVSLRESEWRVIYDTINATIYALAAEAPRSVWYLRHYAGQSWTAYFSGALGHQF
ncbi:MAG: hypothetical protein HKN21_01720 [Candidatus Eisenbacteria bacterium]|uniref:Uncharacterized protein n=1 Tax=Eiseniibacteriota bacterium TaxID=2212470 RepID=A0A7Y2E5F6_UNCEI|nr:hypothetical protein [Candidatus Eisenbacteria bacterium]